MEGIATAAAILAALVAGWPAWEARRSRIDAFKPVWAATNATIAAENVERVARGEQPQPPLSWIKMHGLRHGTGRSCSRAAPTSR